MNNSEVKEIVEQYSLEELAEYYVLYNDERMMGGLLNNYSKENNLYKKYINERVKEECKNNEEFRKKIDLLKSKRASNFELFSNDAKGIGDIIEYFIKFLFYILIGSLVGTSIFVCGVPITLPLSLLNRILIKKYASKEILNKNKMDHEENNIFNNTEDSKDLKSYYKIVFLALPGLLMLGYGIDLLGSVVDYSKYSFGNCVPVISSILKSISPYLSIFGSIVLNVIQGNVIMRGVRKTYNVENDLPLEYGMSDNFKFINPKKGIDVIIDELMSKIEYLKSFFNKESCIESKCIEKNKSKISNLKIRKKNIEKIKDEKVSIVRDCIKTSSKILVCGTLALATLSPLVTLGVDTIKENNNCGNIEYAFDIACNNIHNKANELDLSDGIISSIYLPYYVLDKGLELVNSDAFCYQKTR